MLGTALSFSVDRPPPSRTPWHPCAACVAMGSIQAHELRDSARVKGALKKYSEMPKRGQHLTHARKIAGGSGRYGMYPKRVNVLVQKGKLPGIAACRLVVKYLQDVMHFKHYPNSALTIPLLLSKLVGPV